MRKGRITSAKLVDGRGDDKTFAVFLDFGGSMQGFTGYYFGEGETAEARLDSFCDDLAAHFGKQRLHELEGMEAVALYEARLKGALSSSRIVGLMNPETGERFIASEWFEKNCGVMRSSALESTRKALEQEKIRVLSRQAEIEHALATLEDNIHEWRS